MNNPLSCEPIASRLFKAESDAITAAGVRAIPILHRAVHSLLDCRGKVAVSGVGKSGIAAHKIAATLASTGTPAFFIHPTDALHGDLGSVTADDAVLLISNSARTPELLNMVLPLKQLGCLLIGLFGDTSTRLATSCDLVFDVSVTDEGSPLNLAPMASVAAVMAVGDAIATSLMAARGFTSTDFALRHPGGALGRHLSLRARDIMHSGAGVPLVPPHASIADAIEAMNKSLFGGVLISSANRLEGVFSDGDLRRHVLKGLRMRDPISTVMTKEPITVQSNASAEEMIAAMESSSRKIYFLPVIDRYRHVLGVVRMHDILGN